MKNIQTIKINEGTNEERLPDFGMDFPYIASRAELDKYYEATVPWHWHPAVELFYMESGTLEYTTPNGKWVFPAGSGGLVNSNVLHMTKVVPSGDETIQLLHIFETDFLSGGHGNRMETKYIRPLTSASEIEIIPLLADNMEQANLLKKIRAVFDLNENEWAYEFHLRQQLTEVWLQLLEHSRSVTDGVSVKKTTDDKVKEMMDYIHMHYQEKITAEQLASIANVSKRVCFRLFQDNIHMTPLEYMTNYRLRKACTMLIETTESVTQIAYSCGLGNSSYFGKMFREHFGCTPVQYREKWHDCDIFKHK